MNQITLEEALKLFELPRKLGETPEGESVSANVGRFGPYVRFGDKYASLKDDDDPYTITPERALEFLEDLGDPYAAIGADPRARMGLDWGVVGLPETFVIDGRGNVILRHAGPLTEEVVESRLRPAMVRAAGQ